MNEALQMAVGSGGGALIRAVIGIIKALGDRTFEYIDWRKLIANTAVGSICGLIVMIALEAIPFLKVNWEYRAYIAIIVGFAGSDFFDKHFKSFGLTSSSLGAPMIGQPQESSSISPRQQKALDYIRSSGSINNDQYKELNKVSDRTAVRDMQDLKDKGKVKTQGKGRNVKYVLP